VLVQQLTRSIEPFGILKRMRLGYRDVVDFLQRDAGKLLNPTDRTVRKALVPLDPTQTFLVDAADDLGAKSRWDKGAARVAGKS
jgi:hypothetical protein